jgi:putative glutamine amidotransferase
MIRPLIGLTADLTLDPRGAELSRSELRVAYSDAVAAAGGIPVILPYAVPESTGLAASALPATLERLDALILTGGAFDVPPWLYGESPREGLGSLKPERTEMERQAFLRARELGLPILAICGGMQLVNVLMGGSLYQHLPLDVPDSLEHEQNFDRRKPSHPVEVLPDTQLAQALGRSGGFPVNSSHHQAVKTLGQSLRASARSPDDLVEAIEGTGPGALLLGVEWHPELLVASQPEQRGLFTTLVAACAGHSHSS